MPEPATGACHVAPLLALLLLGPAVAPAQVPDPWGDAFGHVRDHHGAPVQGARVRFVARWSGSVFDGTMEALLRRARPNEARTAADGSYRIALLADHREVSAIGLQWWLLAEKTGFQPWCERLPRGLYGFLGSDVVLHPLDPDDEVTLLAGDADVGAGVAVQRQQGEMLLAEFDADGRARVLLPRVPSPLQPGSLQSMSMRWDVGLGPTTQRLQRPVHRLRAAPADRVATLVRAGGEPILGARALRWNGVESRVVALRDARVATGPDLLAVVAEGCRATAATELHRLPPHPPRRVRIVDPTGAAISHARALLQPWTAWRPAAARTPGGTPSMQTLWSAPRRADARGDVALHDLPRDEPSVLVVAAEGFEPVEVLDPRGLDDEATVVLPTRAAVRLDLRVVDGAGGPIAGARVCLQDHSGAPSTTLGEELLTDAAGRVVAGGLRRIDAEAFVMARGFANKLVPLQPRTEEALAVVVALEPARSSTFLVRAKETGAPQPFASLGAWQAGTAQGGLLRADSAGRLVLPHTPQQLHFQHDGVALDVDPVPDGVGTVWAPLREPLRIEPAAGLALLMAVCRGQSSAWGHDGSFDGVLLFPGPQDRCEVRLLPAGRATLAAEDLAGLPRDPGRGLRRWLVDPPRLDVVLPAGCEAPERWSGLPAGKAPSELDPAALAVFRDERGGWRLIEPSPDELWFVHPRYAPVAVALTPAQRRGEAPIHLPCRPGSSLTLDAALGGVAARNMTVTVEPLDHAGPRVVFRSALRLPRTRQGPRDQLCPLELPALAAGRWTVRYEGELVLAGLVPKACSFVKEIDCDGTTPIELGPDG